ncbi:MAG TPA: hypothetical protein VMH41_10195 [Mycobacteriales bacterium]|nr:hypothetical protein [Mycobacteriales bacterium]
MSAGESPPPEDEAHDVLAAEAFAVPARDPALRHDPIALPEDPSGIAEAHDILAAEEFAMPAPSSPVDHAGRIAAKVPFPVRVVALTAVALGVLRALRRRRRPR